MGKRDDIPENLAQPDAADENSDCFYSRSICRDRFNLPHFLLWKYERYEDAYLLDVKYAQQAV